MGMLLVGGWIGLGGEGGVFTGSRPGDKGPVKIEMDFNKKKKKNLCVFHPDVKQCHGRVRSCVRPCLCGERREQEAI